MITTYILVAVLWAGTKQEVTVLLKDNIENFSACMALAIKEVNKPAFQAQQASMECRPIHKIQVKLELSDASLRIQNRDRVHH